MIRDATITGFCLCGVGIIILVVWGQAGHLVASFPDLMKKVLTSRAATAVILLFWLWVGWHYLVES